MMSASSRMVSGGPSSMFSVIINGAERPELSMTSRIATR